jgi:hypothetical protein
MVSIFLSWHHQNIKIKIKWIKSRAKTYCTSPMYIWQQLSHVNKVFIIIKGLKIWISPPHSVWFHRRKAYDFIACTINIQDIIKLFKNTNIHTHIKSWGPSEIFRIKLFFRSLKLHVWSFTHKWTCIKKYEPCHDKTNIMGLWPAWIQTSLWILVVWSGSMLFVYQPYYK